MEIIGFLIKEVIRGKVEFKFAAILFLGIIISTGSNNIINILTVFMRNELFGVFFSEQLWLIYSIFFASITSFQFGRAKLYSDNIKVEVKKISQSDNSKTDDLEVGLKILKSFQKVINDLVVAMIYLFASLIFTLSLLHKKFGIIMSSTYSIIIIILFSVMWFIYFSRTLIITRETVVEGKFHANMERD